jgi:SAM-dependent methyltransferase
MTRAEAPPTAEDLRLRAPDIAWGWDEAVFNPAWHEPLFEVMARYVPRGARLLEVGAGGSATLGMLAGRLGCEAWGCEPDRHGAEAALRLAEAERARVLVVQGDGFRLPFADGSFDVVYSLGLIEHFTPRESAELVAEHRRVCRTGGRVILSVPNLLNLPHTFHKMILGSRYQYHPERSYSPRQLRAVLEEAGLRVVAADGMLPLWGVAMVPGAWRLTAALARLGLAAQLDGLKSARLRAALGYMTFAVAKRSS